ncbi:MAG: acetoacetate--CoA ligase, partial [Candidatus Neomarinimicrobiota bacterium]
MEPILWEPSRELLTTSQMAIFRDQIENRFSVSLPAYADLYEWSVSHIPDFWQLMWEFSDVRYRVPPESVVDDVHRMPGAQWFSGAQLNFAENLLRYRDDHPALYFQGEGQIPRTLTYREL